MKIRHLEILWKVWCCMINFKSPHKELQFLDQLVMQFKICHQLSHHFFSSITNWVIKSIYIVCCLIRLRSLIKHSLLLIIWIRCGSPKPQTSFCVQINLNLLINCRVTLSTIVYFIHIYCCCYINLQKRK